MSELIWEGYTEDLFNKVIGEIPVAFQECISMNLIEACENRTGMDAIITHSIIVSSMKEVIPRFYIKRALNGIGSKPKKQKSI